MEFAGVVRVGFILVFTTTVSAVPVRADAEEALAILTKHCAGCHADGERAGGFGFVTDLGKLVTEQTVAPGNPLESKLYQYMIEGRMPPEGEEIADERPTAAEVKILADWIRDGAPTTGGRGKPPTRNLISVIQLQQRIADYLRGTPRSQRRSVRFFSLGSVHNNPKRTQAELDVYRAGLGFVINSLSWKREMVPLKSLGPDRIVYAMHLDDAGWDEQTWNTILAHYPYGLATDMLPENRELNELSAELSRMTQVEVPVLRVDWFINTVSRPPLYDTILQIPRKLSSLEERLGVDSDRNLRDGRVHRAGMIQSGVSEQHRLVERHTGTFGYYWKSYDFKPNAARANLTRFPLGPLMPGQPFPGLAFVHDGGEFIFRLPNGLQGYMLADANGNRLDGAAPTAIVSDKGRLSGTVEIFNGISCMACHSQGMISVRDDIRQAAVVRGAARQLVNQLYPARQAMAAIVARDGKAFRQAAVAAMASAGVAPEALRIGDGDVISPVLSVVRFFQKNPMHLEDVAGELGLPAKRLRDAIELDGKLAGLGLRSLLADDGVIKRSSWEQRAASGRSTHQRAASYLNLGEPVLISAQSPSVKENSAK